ncbi:MAG: DNA polymerase III subunit delta' [Dehalococcoidia bacterium]|nr:MAG: DNA polymerase III subunit delta' [Dehalococcoidia bacterium]
MNQNWRLIGLDNIIAFLARTLESDGLFHAYLFSAPQHSGKKALALKLAQALNCVGDNSPCGDCAPCRRIAAGNHADVQIVNTDSVSSDSESKNRVDLSIEQIRGIIHSASFPPYEGRYRVFIIEDAEKMSVAAANALLKTLEEPPTQVVFILTTSKENLLLETIHSRCQRVRLGAATRQQIRSFLEDSLAIPMDQADLFARICEGRTGWAVSVANNDAILNERRDNLEKFFEMMESGYELRFDLAARLAQSFSQKRDEVYRLLDQWLGLGRDVLLYKLNIIDELINIDYTPQIISMSERLDINDIRTLIRAIIETRQYLGRNAGARLALEVLMIGLPLFGGTLKHNG